MYTGIAAKGFTTEKSDEKLAKNSPATLINTVEKGSMSLKNSSIARQRYGPFYQFLD
jgi:hypothetical protein